MTELSISVTVKPTGNGSCIVVSVAGEADVTTRQLGDVLTEEAARKPRLLLVEMTALEFIDSSALRMIIQAYQRLQRDGGVVALVRPACPVRRVLRLTGIDQMITVYDHVDKAIKSLCERQSPGISPGG